MTNIVAIAGAKQSGKSTAVNYLHGYEMKRHGFIKYFDVSPEGKLLVNALYQDDDENPIERAGIFDLEQKGESFTNYATNSFWPFVRGFSFAAPLKEICVNLFGLSPEQAYGTDEQKNSLTKHNWADMPGVIIYDNDEECDELFESLGAAGHLYFKKLGKNEEPRMTGREFMQFMGTDVFRKMYGKIWTDYCLNDIKNTAPDLALISDCRFENEINAIQEKGGKVIYLTRNETTGGHSSEKAGEYRELYDAIIDNANMSIEEQNEAIKEQLCEWGILPRRI